MRMDKELIKDLLLKIKHGKLHGWVTDKKIVYHIDLLIQAGWVTGENIIIYESGLEIGADYNSLKLTWEGSEVSDIFELGWETIKGKSLIEYPFEIIIDYLKNIKQHELELERLRLSMLSRI